VNALEALREMEEGQMIALSNSDTFFRLYRNDMIVMLVQTTKVASHVCSVQTIETFIEQFKNKNKFQIYE